MITLHQKKVKFTTPISIAMVIVYHHGDHIDLQKQLIEKIIRHGDQNPHKKRGVTEKPNE